MTRGRWWLVATGVLVVWVLASAPLATAAQGGEPRTHVVEWGETLTAIAARYGVTLDELLAANDIADANLVYAGLRLTIPAPARQGTATLAPTATATSSPQTTRTPTPPIPPPGPDGRRTHVVQVGETLFGIALRYGVSSAALAATNGIANPRLIFAGQTLVISPLTPAPAVTAAPAPAEATPEPSPTTPPDEGGEAPPQGEPATYVVQKGDYLSRIAAQHGITLAELLAANDIADPGTIHAGLVLAIPAPKPGPPPAERAVPQPTVLEGKQIMVVLSQQRVYAFENGELLHDFLVSTGLPYTPTVQGDFAVYLKVRAQRMSGPGYNLPNVQWVSYFYRDYALHGTYWHSNFGQPMSRGCVNMRNEDAQWVYEWAPEGTSVVVMN